MLWLLLLTMSTALTVPGGSYALSSVGTSPAMLNQRKAVTRLFDNSFRSSQGAVEHLPGLPPWAQIGKAVLCTRHVYELFAFFLLHAAIEGGNRNAGAFYAVDTVLSYLGILINLASHKFKHNNEDTRMFFTCLDSSASTDDAMWLRGIKLNIRRTCFQRAKDAGTEMDMSATPLYLCHVMAMILAYSLVGTREAAHRAFVLLCAHAIAGRAAELAFLTLDAMEWDPHLKAVICEVPQSKIQRPTTMLVSTWNPLDHKGWIAPQRQCK